MTTTIITIRGIYVRAGGHWEHVNKLYVRAGGQWQVVINNR